MSCIVLVVRIALITCAAWPTLSSSDALLATALQQRGHEVVAVPWNDSDGSGQPVDVAVLRSNWDFHHHLDNFMTWLRGQHDAGVRVINDLQLVEWNANKHYLIDLAARGIAVPRTETIDEVRADVLHTWFATTGCDDAVLKPAWGASGHLVERITADRVDAAVETVAADSDGRPYIIQEFIPEITDGELALVYFDGEFSHSVARIPTKGEFRVNSGRGGTVQQRDAVDAQVRFGRTVLDALASMPTYARVDLVATATGPVLMEVELNEPALWLDLSNDGADRFAAAVLAAAERVV